MKIEGSTTFATAHLKGSSSTLGFGPVYVLGGTVLFEGPDTGTRKVEMNGSNGTLTIGPTGVMRTTADFAGSASIGGQFPVTFGGSMTLVNQGLISSQTNSRAIDIPAAGFTNSGIVEAKSGGTLTLIGNWSNPGVISINAGTVNLGGNFTNVGTFSRTGGTVNLIGTLNNAGSTLTLNASTGSLNLAGGTISGGTLAYADGQILAMTSSGGTLTGLTVNGDLDLSASGAKVKLEGSTTFATAHLKGNSSTLGFAPGYVLGGTVLFEGPDTGSRKVEMNGSNGTLTIGPTGVIRTTADFAGSASIGGQFPVTFGGSMTLVNQGLISSQTNSRAIDIPAAGFTNSGIVEAKSGGTLTLIGNWSNPGVISINAGTVNLGGNFTNVGTFSRTGGTVNLIGTLNNAGSTLTLNASTGSLNLAGGTISGGTLAYADGQILAMTSSGGTLTGLTVNGDLDLSASGAKVKIEGSTTFATAHLKGSSSSLGFAPGYVLGGTVLFEGPDTGTRKVEMNGSNGTLTIGPTGVMRTTADFAGSASIGGQFPVTFGGSMTLVNQGLISSQTNSRAIDIPAAGFTNSGIVEAKSGGTLTLIGNWSNPGVISINAGTVNLGGNFTNVGTFSRTGGTVNLIGTLNNAGSTLTLNASTGSLNLAGGTISGGTLAYADGQILAMTSSGGTLTGLTVNGDLDLSASGAKVKIEGSTTFATAHLKGSSSSLGFAPGYVLGGTVLFEGPDTGTRKVEMNGSNGTLTIGPTGVMRTTADFAGSASIGGQFPLTFGGSMTLVNQGLISSQTNSRAIDIPAAGFTNSGIVEAKSGGTLTLIGNWSNPGVISINAGTVNLGGNFTNVGTFSRTGGTVNLIGTLNNAGSTLTLNASTGSLNLAGGTISGGTLAYADGQILAMTSGGGTLTGVTVNGDLDLSASGAKVKLEGSTTFATAHLKGSSSSLGFAPGYVLGGTVLFEGPDTGTRKVEMNGSNGTLTIGPTGVMRTTADFAGSASIGGQFPLTFGGSMTLVNQGLISSQTNSRAIDIPAAGFTNSGIVEAKSGGTLTLIGNWSNPGVISINAGTVNLGGNFTNVGTFSRTGGTVNLIGALNNTASTLTLNASTGSLNLAGGTISGGTLAYADGQILAMTSGGGTLTGVTVNGDLDLSASGAKVKLEGSTTFATAHLKGNSSTLGFAPGYVLGGTVLFEGPDTGSRKVEMNGSNGTLTIGPTGVIRTTADFAGSASIGGQFPVTFGGSMTLVNQGLISSQTNSRAIDIPAAGFTNSGIVEAKSGGTLTLIGNWSNPGVISINAGTVNLGGNFTNVGTFSRTGGTVNLIGTLNNAGSTLTLNASTGSLNLAGGTISGGTLAYADGQILAMTSSGGTLTGLTVNGDLDLSASGAKVKIEGSTTFATAHLKGSSSSLGFAPGYVLGGTVLFEGPDTGTRKVEMNGSNGTLTIGPTGVMRTTADFAGSASIGGQFPVTFGGSMTLINQGLISSQTNGRTVTINPATSFTNQGTIEAKDGGILEITSSLSNLAATTLTGGTWSVGPNGVLRVTGAIVVTNNATIVLDGANSNFYQNSGTTSALTSLNSIGSTGSLSITGGRNLTVPANLTNNGTITIGDGSTLSVTGNFQQAATANLFSLISGTAANAVGKLSVTQVATLDGTLNARAVNNFSPIIGNTFQPIAFGSRAGTFATVNGQNLSAGILFRPTYNSTNLTLETLPAIVVTPNSGLTTTEAGGTAQFNVVLGAPPSANVAFGVTSSNPSEGQVGSSLLTFTPANWNVPQTVTITGVDEAIDDGNTPYFIVTQAAVSSDPQFNGVNPSDVSLVNIDDDVSGITVNPTSGLVSSEVGGTGQFSVVLTSQPTADVTIPLSSNNTTEGTLAVASLVFTPANWNVPQSVTVTGVDDLVDDGDISYTILTAAATSSDALYNSMNAADVTVINLDNDTAGIAVSAISGNTSEAGGAATFSVVLNSQPTANVTIPLSSNNTTEGTLAVASLVFTPANWNVPQSVTVTGVDDAVDDGDITYTILTAAANSSDAIYNSMSAADVTVINLDNDTAGISVSAISGNTSEAGATATFSVVLNSQPTANVTIPLSSNDTTEGTLAVASLVFTSANWNVPQSVTVTGVDDLVDDGDITYNILTAAATSSDAFYNGMNAADVTVINLDNDTAGISVSAISGNTSEAGATATFSVVLNSQPTANVTIPLSSNDTTEGTLAVASLVFTPANWNVPQSVTVTGVDDLVDDGDITYTILTAAATSSDAIYNGMNAADVTVINLDNDTAGISVSAISGNTSEAGATATFSVVLNSQPTANVTIPLSSNDTTEGTLAVASLVFTLANWNVPQSVTVTGVDDLVDDGDISYTILTTAATSSDAIYNSMNAADVTVINVDNDTAGINVSAISGNTSEAGGAATFSVVLNSQPTANVTIPLSSNDTTEGTLAVASLVFTPANWNVPQSVTVTGVDDLVDDGDITYNILTAAATSSDALYNSMNAADVTVINVDNDTAGISVSAISGNTSEAGATATFSVVLNSQPTANVTIPLSSNDTTEGTLAVASLVFTSANWNVPQIVTVTGVDDALIDGDVSYLIVTSPAASSDTNYSGLNPSDVLLVNIDDDTANNAQPPIASDLSVSTNEDSATGVTLVASDPNGDPLTFAIVSGPAHGVLSGTAPNLVYTPFQDYFGSDSFTYVANDGSLDSNVATVSLIVVTVNDAPLVANPIADRVVAESAASFTINLGNVFADVDDLVFTFAASSSNPGLVNATVVNGIATVTMTNAKNGLAMITVTATDSGNLSVSDAFNVTVLNSLPTLAVSSTLDGYSGVTGQDRLLRLTATDATDNGVRPFTYEILWGDGSPLETISGPSVVDASHAYATTGSKTVQVRTIDPDGGASAVVTRTLNILSTEVQGNVLAIGGNSIDDVLAFTPGASAPAAQVLLNGFSLGAISVPAGGIKFFGGSGNDTLIMNGTAGIDTFTTDGSSIVWNGSATWPLGVRLDSAGVEKLRVQAQAGNDEIIIGSGTAEVDGGAGTDRITGPNSGGLWNVSGAGIGSLNGLSFLGIETVLGGSGDDTFIFGATGAFTGIVDGNGGQDTLNFSAKTTAITISLLANTATSTGGIRNFEQFIGGTATDTFTAPNTANAWQLTGQKSGLLNLTIGFSGFETLKGGTSTDDFAVVPAASSFTSVDGGSGSDSLNYSAFSTSVQVDLAAKSAPGIASFVGFESLIGSSTSDLLIGPNSVNAWTIDGQNSGKLGTTLFQSFESIQGGTNNDSVTFTVTGGLAGDFNGTAGVDTVIGPNLDAAWNIDSHGGTLTTGGNTVRFRGIENLTGGTGVDQFTFQPAAVLTGTINGGAGIDKIDLSQESSSIEVINTTIKSITGTLVGFTAVEQVLGGSSINDQITGINAVTPWSFNSAGQIVVSAVTYSGFEVIQGGNLVDTLIGPNLDAAWNIDSQGGTLTTGGHSVRFRGIENLTGGTAVDQFTFQPEAVLTGTINGGAGIDKIDLSQESNSIEVINSTIKSITGTLVGFTAVEQVLGGSSINDQITGINAVTPWSFNSAGQIVVSAVTYSGFEAIQGGNLVDTLTGPNLDATWNIDGQGGTLTTGGHSVRFRGIENLTGGTAVDQFTFQPEAVLTGTINGGAGIDKIDLSQESNLIEVINSTIKSITGTLVGFTAVEQVLGGSSTDDQITGINAVTPWSFNSAGQIVVGSVTYSDFEVIQGGTAVDTLTGPNLDATWDLDNQGGTLSSGENTVRFRGIENLTGGTAIDQFIFQEGAVVSGTINGGTGIDRIDLSQLNGIIEVVNTTIKSIGELLLGFTGVEQLLGGTSNNDRVRAADVATAWQFNASGQILVGGVTYTGFEVMRGGSAVDTITGPAQNTSWTLDAFGGGSVTAGTTAVRFANMENITSGAGNDTLVVLQNGVISGTLNLGAGADVLDLSGLEATDVILTGTATRSLVDRISTFTAIEQVLGTANDSINGGTIAGAWAINPSGQILVGGTTFTGFGSIVAGALTDTLTGPNVDMQWTLTGLGSGSVAVGDIQFSGIDSLLGGTASDIFEIGPTGSLAGALNGGATGRNVLSYKFWSNPVTVNLATRIASGIAGQVTNFTIVQGGSGDDQLTGNASLGTILLGMSGNDSLVGGSGRDILIGGFGSDTLSGGSGDDLLIASATAFDYDIASLSSIFDEWSNTSRNYRTRVNNLRGIGTGPRLNGNLFLQNSPTPTLYADPGKVDQLIGRLGQDWFITDDAADITDQVLTGLLAELRDEVDAPPV